MIDWPAVFVSQNSFVEVILRGTLVYFLLFTVLRLFLNRQAGAIGIPDLLVIVLIVESTTDALGSNESITDAAILVVTVMFWSYGIQWLTFRFPRLQFLVSSPQVKLIDDGKMLRRNMRKELVTEDELMSLLRTQGVDDMKKVKLACLESSGDISVVTYDDNSDQNGHKNRARDGV